MSCGCGCSPVTTMGALGGLDGGECDTTFPITYPSDVDKLKARLLAAAEATDLGVQSCQGLDPLEKQAWDLEIGVIREFAHKETPLFGSYNEWLQSCAHFHELDAWKVKLSATCKLPGPDPRDTKGASTVVLDALPWIAGSVIAVAVVVGLFKVTAFIPAPRKKR